MLETDLRSCKYQRLAIISQHLPSQQVEIVGWHCHLSYLEIDVLPCKVVVEAIQCVVGLGIHILEESLNMASGVLRSSTIETVWQKEHHATLSQPFGFRAHEVLINNELGRIVEITKLSLPKTQVLWVLKGVTILISHCPQLV